MLAMCEHLSASKAGYVPVVTLPTVVFSWAIPAHWPPRRPVSRDSPGEHDSGQRHHRDVACLGGRKVLTHGKHQQARQRLLARPLQAGGRWRSEVSDLLSEGRRAEVD